MVKSRNLGGLHTSLEAIIPKAAELFHPRKHMQTGVKSTPSSIFGAVNRH